MNGCVVKLSPEGGMSESRRRWTVAGTGGTSRRVLPKHRSAGLPWPTSRAPEPGLPEQTKSPRGFEQVI